VQRERQRARLDPALTQKSEHLLLQRTRTRREPALEHEVRLDRPAELVVAGGEVEHRVEIGEVVSEHPVLRVRVADVQVRVVDDEYAPRSRWPHLDLRGPDNAARLGSEPDRPRGYEQVRLLQAGTHDYLRVRPRRGDVELALDRR
jgi:hypothetical protein